jgi:hypothetical protein
MIVTNRGTRATVEGPTGSAAAPFGRTTTMTEITPQGAPARPEKPGLHWPQVTAIVLVAVVATALLTVWLVRTYLFPSQFEPVTLSAAEEQQLEAKLQRLEALPPAQPADRDLTPEPYTEDDAARTVAFSERELNALLAKNTDLAERLAIDLSDKLISAKLLVPMDEEFPILGGRILRINTGLMFDYEDGRPIVKLKGVSLMGVPLPNAWLGGLKNVDLVAEFGADEGFWQAFAAGVADVKVREGNLVLRLRE